MKSTVSAPAQPQPPTFVAISRFIVRNGMRQAVADAFRNRPHLVDAAPGFIEMRVLSPADNPDEFWLVTEWTDEASFRAWHGSHDHRAAHKGIPRGLRLDPSGTSLRFFETVAR